jgi:micrococcal nuclease
MTTTAGRSRPDRQRRVASSLAASVALVLAASGCSPDAITGKVVRVIDGDTLVVRLGGEERTVRLLNVDTPEMTHPDRPAECLGPEATDFLRRSVPPGSMVGLNFDVEREDQYGRTLAAVFLEEGTLVNAEIARKGLGIPVYFAPNREYLGEVEAAHKEAQGNGSGLHDEELECSRPTQAG